MATIILMWKPELWAWDDLTDTVAAIRAGEPRELSWSVGTTKNIAVGSRTFMLRLGDDRPGFMASGWISTVPTPGPHWDSHRAAAGEQTNYVTITIDVLLDPSEEPPMDWPPRAGPLLTKALRHLQGSGKSISDAAVSELEDLWTHFTGSQRSLGGAGDGAGEWQEGAVQWRYVKHRSRERGLRRAKLQAALQRGPLRCEVPGCGFDFEHRYGAIGRGFAHVHHLVPLGSLDVEHSVSLDDLAIICANCHAMVHRNGECRALATLVPASARVSSREHG